MCSADMCAVCFALKSFLLSFQQEVWTFPCRCSDPTSPWRFGGLGPVNMLSNPSTCVFLWNCGRKDGIVYLVQLESDVEDDSLIIEQACQEDDTSLRVRAGSERVCVLTIDLIWYWISFQTNDSFVTVEQTAQSDVGRSCLLGFPKRPSRHEYSSLEC